MGRFIFARHCSVDAHSTDSGRQARFISGSEDRDQRDPWDLPSRAKVAEYVDTPGSSGMHFFSDMDTSYIPVILPNNSEPSRYSPLGSASEITPHLSTNFSGWEPSKFHFQMSVVVRSLSRNSRKSLSGQVPTPLKRWSYPVRSEADEDRCHRQRRRKLCLPRLRLSRRNTGESCLASSVQYQALGRWRFSPCCHRQHLTPRVRTSGPLGT